MQRPPCSLLHPRDRVGPQWCRCPSVTAQLLWMTLQCRPPANRGHRTRCQLNARAAAPRAQSALSVRAAPACFKSLLEPTTVAGCGANRASRRVMGHQSTFDPKKCRDQLPARGCVTFQCCGSRVAAAGNTPAQQGLVQRPGRDGPHAGRYTVRIELCERRTEPRSLVGQAAAGRPACHTHGTSEKDRVPLRGDGLVEQDALAEPTRAQGSECGREPAAAQRLARPASQLWGHDACARQAARVTV